MKKELEQIIEQEDFDSIVLYRLPNKTDKQIILGKCEKIYNGINALHCTDKGFVFEPFDNTKSEGLFIDCVYTNTYTSFADSIKDRLHKYFSFSDEKTQIVEDDYENYKANFDKMHRGIADGKVSKVILSRIQQGPKVQKQQIINLFDELAAKYPHAFVYTVSSKDCGTWLGAGPELLIKHKNNSFTTVSLAGTLPNAGNSNWSSKEANEQQLVTNYIENTLIHHQAENIEYDDPQTVIAGQVKHLCTTFNFDLERVNGNHIGLLYDLHPTPAVCGMPKENAYQLILETENHFRQFYSGFLGPVNNGAYEFYVNIRCLQVFKDKTALYVGGGLTIDSEAEKEWQETQMKAQTLLSVLKNI